MTCCCGRPAGGKVIGPTAGRALRRYLSDKQRTPPSRGAEHVAKCGPELLTPQMGQGDPAYVSRNTGRAGWHGELAPHCDITAAPDISTARMDPAFPPANRPTWATSWRQEDNHCYVCSGKCV